MFSEGRPGDVLLLHFSCHGLKSESGELFFAAANTRPDRLRATAVAADFVQRCMRDSRARSVVLLLDCCYGGAFARGVTVRAAGDVNVLDSFPQERPGGGRGRAVITASSSMEYAFEGDQLAGNLRGQPSVFTSALVEGLATGEADLDEDGWIALDELYDYVFEKVRERNPHQTPSRQVELAGELYLARSRRHRIRPVPIPPDLQAALTDPNMYTRLGAVSDLRSRLASGNLPVAAGAYEALAELARTAIQYVADPAAVALREAAVRPSPTELHFGQLTQGSPPPHQTIQLFGPPIARACTPRPSHNWIRVDETAAGFDISIDTAHLGPLRGSVDFKGPTGEAAVAIKVDLFHPPPRQTRRLRHLGKPASQFPPPPARIGQPERPPWTPLPPEQSPGAPVPAPESPLRAANPPPRGTGEHTSPAPRHTTDSPVHRSTPASQLSGAVPPGDNPPAQLAPVPAPRGPQERVPGAGAATGPAAAPTAGPEVPPVRTPRPRRLRLLALAVLSILAAGGIAVALLASPPPPSYAIARTLTDPGTGSEGAYSVAFSPDGKTLAVGGWNGKVYLWDAATGQMTATLTVPGAGQRTVWSVAFSPDGKTLAAGDDDGRTYLWDVATGKLTATLTDPNTAASGVQAVAFSPDGKTLAAGDDDGRTYLWDVATGNLTATLTNPNPAAGPVRAVAFSPDGKTLAAGGDNGRTYLWDVATGNLTATLTNPNPTAAAAAVVLPPADGVQAVAFSPDGKTLAAGDDDGRTYLWDVATGNLTATLTDPYPAAGPVRAVAFSPDGKTLAAGNSVGKIFLWMVQRS